MGLGSVGLENKTEGDLAFKARGLRLEGFRVLGSGFRV